jgi:hypothetical protein
LKGDSATAADSRPPRPRGEWGNGWGVGHGDTEGGAEQCGVETRYGLASVASGPIFGFLRTTHDLPKDVLAQAESFAAQHRTTLDELTTEGLRSVTRAAANDVEATATARSTRLLMALKDLVKTGKVDPLRRELIYDRSST